MISLRNRFSGLVSVAVCFCGVVFLVPCRGSENYIDMLNISGLRGLDNVGIDGGLEMFLVEKTWLMDEGIEKKHHKDLPAVLDKDGKALYQTYCASCHRDDGVGMEGTFPPLQQNEWVKNEGKFIHVMLNGLSGEIEVNGVAYDQFMPAFSFLRDEEISNIVNYVRKSFGNNYKEVSSAKIQKMRKKLTSNL